VHAQCALYPPLIKWTACAIFWSWSLYCLTPWNFSADVLVNNYYHCHLYGHWLCWCYYVFKICQWSWAFVQIDKNSAKIEVHFLIWQNRRIENLLILFVCRKFIKWSYIKKCENFLFTFFTKIRVLTKSWAYFPNMVIHKNDIFSKLKDEHKHLHKTILTLGIYRHLRNYPRPVM